jgi:SNF2 family DNA or RNA helicase
VRIALTGTPVENNLSELWSIIDWSVPGLLGPLETFRRTIALPIERDGDRKATERLQRLVEPFLLRRTKTDEGIAPELPAKIERDLIVPLSDEQVTLYKATTEHVLAEVAGTHGIDRRGLILKFLTGLKQITNHPAQFLHETGPLDARSGKLDALDDLLATATAANESTLIFSQYVAMANLIVKHQQVRGRQIAVLHGGLSVKARQELVDRFQAGDLQILVLSLKAGGTGLNLTAATHVVHYDRWWNPAVEDQATDRAYRIGQTKAVTVHRIITEGTVEDRVADLLTAKRKLAASVTGAGESWIGDLDDDDLAELVELSVS